MRKKLGLIIPLLLLAFGLSFTSFFLLPISNVSASIRPGDIRNNNFRYKVVKTNSGGSTTITIEGYSKASSGSVNQTWGATEVKGNTIIFTPVTSSGGTDAVSFKIYVNKSNYAKGVVYTLDGEKMNGQSDLNIQNSDAAKNATNATTTPTTGTPTSTDTPSTDDEETEDPAPSCDVEISNPLSWIICPVITLIQEGVNIFYNAANRALNVEIEGDPSDPDSAYSGFYTAWGNLRNIANVLFVIALLAIIISQLIVGKM